MNLMKHNLVQRGLSEYNAGLLYLLGRIMGKGKGYTSRGGGIYHYGIRILYQAEYGGKITMFTIWKIGGVPEEISFASPYAWPAGYHDVPPHWSGDPCREVYFFNDPD